MPSTQLQDVAFRFVPDDSAAMTDELLKGRNDHDVIDILDGGGGDDVVLGLNGSDLLIGGDGKDEITGNDGGNMDFLVGGIVDAKGEVNVQALIDGLVQGLGVSLEQAVAGLVEILDNAENLEDVITGIGDALKGTDLTPNQILTALRGNFTWEQDGYSDDFNASATFEENGIDIIGGYDDDASDGVFDVIDFSDAISFNRGNNECAKETALLSQITYDPGTGALADSAGNDWFFVFSNVNPLAPSAADTVYVEVDGDVFTWNGTDGDWDMV